MQISSIQVFQGIQKQKEFSSPHFLPSRDFYPDIMLVEFCGDWARIPLMFANADHLSCSFQR
jgi:hypothetical protein